MAVRVNEWWRADQKGLASAISKVGYYKSEPISPGLCLVAAEDSFLNLFSVLNSSIPTLRRTSALVRVGWR